jgi:hypothetical protein
MADPNKPVQQGSDDGLVSHSHTETPEEVAAFWNEERIREARPLPLPEVPKKAAPPTAPDGAHPSNTSAD